MMTTASIQKPLRYPSPILRKVKQRDAQSHKTSEPRKNAQPTKNSSKERGAEISTLQTSTLSSISEHKQISRGFLVSMPQRGESHITLRYPLMIFPRRDTYGHTQVFKHSSLQTFKQNLRCHAFYGIDAIAQTLKCTALPYPALTRHSIRIQTHLRRHAFCGIDQTRTRAPPSEYRIP